MVSLMYSCTPNNFKDGRGWAVVCCMLCCCKLQAAGLHDVLLQALRCEVALRLR